MSKSSRNAPSHGTFAPGEKVEVLSEEEGFSSAWATGTVISHSKGGGFLVEYSKFVDADGKALREKVRQAADPARAALGRRRSPQADCQIMGHERGSGPIGAPAGV